MQKSEIIAVEVEEVDRVASIFSCKVGKFPTSYLGLLFRASHKSCVVWNAIEKRFKRKLASWEKQYLPKEAKLVLIKNIVSSPTIYFMSLFTIPRKLRIRLDKIQRRKIHLVSWSNACKHKKYEVGGPKSSLTRQMVVEVCF